MTKSRCEIIFEASIKSEHTRINYLRCMKKFKAFVGVEGLDELLHGDQKAIQEKVEDYVIPHDFRYSKISVLSCNLRSLNSPTISLARFLLSKLFFL